MAEVDEKLIPLSFGRSLVVRGPEEFELRKRDGSSVNFHAIIYKGTIFPRLYKGGELIAYLTWGDIGRIMEGLGEDYERLCFFRH